ncbi:YebC/PmpR family DNA-binding transcriptional regulator [Neptunomonas phycophila]|jgi:YebC/PmpR family DNA-binding regulatory protein|uniref:Probable transcriptional regulatory protein Q4490_11920 n=1 Tax=Neptunomonas phycophila TaxID=1572645 RepID=A0AAW7XJG8_9GAMM|nr:MULTISPECIES: YebC/PmpR family DNA-binding transcriptional regulator [Neptunomonas]MBT3144946.1 YebC/PmpR family DNA-binding transcriptional regulator [Neptunomonas phycophila]MDN2658443.1 YebC/PmpR family DNA-binding transcriptional regulator [Neptunomonas sp. CHC150]MDO6454270.1 YebC/PmpR family DNA-binding transcriptional regulator [Neptunomonas phycophila]MDO6468785.1 YebC/PmpR family DNA-binding transcriptional regulator [Neptunomonas phycophila]MDO6785360.1 YebC/PmpR family DNA-bindin
MGRAYQNRKESMAKTSDMKAKIYSRYGREIYMSAKTGGSDPTGNLSLRSLIERAKKDQVPSHVIDKALAKAQGGAGEDFSPARYEGYGPGNCMVIIDCLTDNPNRTFGDVRNCFTKSKAKIGTQGSVAHMFDHDAIFVFNGDDDEVVLEALMEADVDVTDVEVEDGKVSVFTPNTEFFATKTALEEAFPDIDFDVAEIQFIPKVSTTLDNEDDIAMFEKFMGMLNELDDVQNVYHNVEGQ